MIFPKTWTSPYVRTLYSTLQTKNVLQATYSTKCTQLASRLSNITTVTTGQITICSKNAVWPPEDGRKDARNMLRNNWLTVKSLIVASSWSRIYLLIKDARSLEHKIRRKFMASSSKFLTWLLKVNAAWGQTEHTYSSSDSEIHNDRGIYICHNFYFPIRVYFLDSFENCATKTH